MEERANSLLELFPKINAEVGLLFQKVLINTWRNSVQKWKNSCTRPEVYPVRFFFFVLEGEGGRWKVEGGGWRVESGGWRVGGGRLFKINFFFF
jgi:hypothetical protein